MPESELLKCWVSNFSLGIGLAISFPLTSKPFTIMHKSSIVNFKKCFGENEIVVYSWKRIRLKRARWGKYQERWKWEQNIQTNEHMGSFIQSISRWFPQWAFSKHLWILRNILLIAALPQSKSPFFCENSSLIYLCTSRPFGFSAHASLFLGCPFHFIFFCFTARLKLELCSKWMKFFLFP